MKRLFGFLLVLFLPWPALAATDSYRWLHVTIDTPWAIFIFLLPMVLLPAMLMAFLYWRYMFKKPKKDVKEDYSDEKLFKEETND